MLLFDLSVPCLTLFQFRGIDNHHVLSYNLKI